MNPNQIQAEYINTCKIKLNKIKLKYLKSKIYRFLKAIK